MRSVLQRIMAQYATKRGGVEEEKPAPAPIKGVAARRFNHANR